MYSAMSSLLITVQLFVYHYSQVYGSKGASISHHPFNMAKGFVVDDLHCVYFGILVRGAIQSIWVQHSLQGIMHIEYL